MEWYCCKKADESGRYRLKNSAIPKEPHVSEPIRAELLDNFDSMKILLSALNYPIFEEVKKPPARQIVFCTGKSASATGKYTEEGMVVFAGSACALEEAKSAQQWLRNWRSRLASEGLLVPKKDRYELKSDYVFPSPSTAASVVLGRSANGWTAWKYKDGRTLSAVHR